MPLTALIPERTPAGLGGRGSVLAGVAFVAGTAAGPVAAGVLAQYAPAAQSLPYLVHLVLLALGWRRVSALPRPGQRAQPWRPTRPHIPAGLRRLFGTAAATGFLAWAVAGLFLAVIPAILGRTAHTGNLAVTGSIAGAVLACSVLTQPLVRRCGAKRAQLGGLSALLGSLLALALTGGGSMSVTLAAAVVAGAGHGLAYGGSTAAVDTVVPDSRRGAINAALYLACYLGSAVPAVAVGLLTLSHPLTTATAWLSAAAAALVPVVGAVLVLDGRSSRPRRNPSRLRGPVFGTRAAVPMHRSVLPRSVELRRCARHD